MVFSSHQSLFPVTSVVKSAVMLWQSFWFLGLSAGVKAPSDHWTLEVRVRVWRLWSQCVCVCGYVCVLLQDECGVITSQLFHAWSVCQCVRLARYGRRWEVYDFSPFMLNVIQTTPLTHTRITRVLHSYSKKRKVEIEIKSWDMHTILVVTLTHICTHTLTYQKKCTIGPNWCCSLECEREPCLAAWGTPFELDLVCVRVCVCVQAGLPGRHTKPLYIHVAAKCSLENNSTLTCTHPKGSRGQPVTCVS